MPLSCRGWQGVDRATGHSALFLGPTGPQTEVIRLPTRLLPILGIAAAVGAYLRWFRPWQLTWGAGPEEVSRAMPGDELVPQPTFNATRAITIGAAPERIWPWLVQVGLGRGGWYSYDILDNLGRPSARRIIPELQNLAVGDIVPMSPDGRHGIPVQRMDPPLSMVWGAPGVTSWTWQLEPVSDGSTRVISRIRARYRWFPPAMAFSALVEFGDIWMMRKMLLNLRERAETVQLPGQEPLATPPPLSHKAPGDHG